MDSQHGTFRCDDDSCAHSWTAELLPLWVPDEFAPHCPECGLRGWLEQIVPAREVSETA